MNVKLSRNSIDEIFIPGKPRVRLICDIRNNTFDACFAHLAIIDKHKAFQEFD